MSGWLKLHRKALENPHLREPDAFRFWCWLLANATHQPVTVFRGKGGREVRLGVGQLALSLGNGIDGLTRKRARTLLERFDRHGMVQIDARRDVGHVVTITRWAEYQDVPEPQNARQKLAKNSPKTVHATGHTNGAKNADETRHLGEPSEGDGPSKGPNMGQTKAKQRPTAQEGIEGEEGKERESAYADSCASGASDDGRAVAVLSPADGRPLARKERYPTKAKLPRDGRLIRWPPEFEAAWQAYPVRTEDTREACYAHWRRHVVDNRVDPARILEAAEAWGMLLSGYEFRIGFLRFCREALWNQPPPKRREEPKSNGQLVAESIARERRGEMWDPFGEIENEQREREHRALHAVCRDDEAGGFEGSAHIGGGAHGPDGTDGANVVRLLAAGGVRRL